MTGFYGADLAYIHDAGFRDYGLRAAPGILTLLRRYGIPSGMVVDLGCGSGRWAHELHQRGYRVLGIDQSPTFLKLARAIAPGVRFVCGSLWDSALPPCDAVTAVGECINYRTGRPAQSVAALFGRIHAALRPGGVFIFDVAGPDRIPSAPLKRWTEGPEWAVLSESRRGPRPNTLDRRIVCYRRIGRRYRRSEETHRLRLFSPAGILASLRSAGFQARQLPGYGRFRPPEGIHVFLAQRPLTRT